MVETQEVNDVTPVQQLHHELAKRGRVWGGGISRATLPQFNDLIPLGNDGSYKRRNHREFDRDDSRD